MLKQLYHHTIRYLFFPFFLVLGGMTMASDLVSIQVTGPLSAKPGQSIQVMLNLTVEPPWHIYFTNPGEAGQGPTFEWESQWNPSIRWPVPRIFDGLGVRGYGYSGSILIPMLATVPTSTQPLLGRMNWVACHETCISGSTDIQWSLSQQGPLSYPSTWQNQWKTAQSLLPQKASYPLHASIINHEWHIQPPYPSQGAPIPMDPRVIWIGDDANWRFKITEPPQDQRILIRYPDGSGELTTVVLITSNWLKWAVGMLGAIAGGVLLLLMPCVFPVFSLKVVGLLSQPNQQAHRRHLLWTVLGIMTSFCVLSVLLLTIRYVGGSVGWGFQLQNPWITLGLVVVMAGMALHMMGVMTMGLSATRLGVAQDGDWGAFLSGCLITVVATPCTGPFLGAAIGFALTQPLWVGWCLLMGVGIGVSLPYIVLMIVPNWVRVLPKPGPWMETLKEWLSFGLWATVVWLASVLVRQTSVDTGVLVGFGLVLWAMACWWWGKHHGRWDAWLAILLGACSPFLLFYMARHAEPVVRTPYSELVWHAPSPTFLIFTADWCVTCQVNERVLFKNRQVQSYFKAHNIQVVEADWTLKSPSILEALNRVGRQSVPTYVWIPSANATPVVLPSVMTPQQLLRYLKK